MASRRSGGPGEVEPDLEEQAAQAFARRRFGPWSADEESALEIRLGRDASYADAYRRVEQSWGAVGQQATSAELMAMREHALSRARRATARRWSSGGKHPHLWRLASALAVAGIVLSTGYYWVPFGWKPGQYKTGIGEQRIVELDDHSRIAMDAATRLRVQFSKQARVVQLISGQAQFSVAKDAARPFEVEAGNHVVVAVGTVFTVEYIGQEMKVAMLEGKVAVLPQPSDAGSVDERARALEAPSMKSLRLGTGDIYLIAGQALRVRGDGQETVTPHADLEAMTAWREGKVIFHNEPLGEAVRELNRYSSVQIEISDPTLASMQVSGVFEAGDVQAFVEAAQSYLPVSVDDSQSGTIRLYRHPN